MDGNSASKSTKSYKESEKCAGSPISKGTQVDLTLSPAKNLNDAYHLSMMYMQAMNDIQSMLNFSLMQRYQQQFTGQMANLEDLCMCSQQAPVDISMTGQVESFTAVPEKNGIAIPNLGFAFPSFVNLLNTQNSYSRKDDNSINEFGQLANAANLNLLSPNKEGSCLDEDQSNLPASMNDQEEHKDDDYLLIDHPYEIKFILNKKTNRKLKRMVCKFGD